MPLSTPPPKLLIPLRDSRDRIIQILGIGVPYPLRDLPLEYPPMVAVGETIKITIVGGQTVVRYRLCDGEGNDLPGGPYEVVPKGTEVDAGVTLTGPLIREDVACTTTAIRTPPFSVSDFVDLFGFVKKLTSQADAVSSYLWNNFSSQAQEVLNGSAASPEQQGKSLAAELNRILQSGASIYDDTRFAGVKLSESTTSLKSQNPTPTGDDLIRLNRLLVEDAYSLEIAKNRLETYLNQVVEVLVGIDQSLGAAFAPQGSQVAGDKKLFVDYGEQDIAVTINNSQEGITYQLFQEILDPNNNVWKEGPSLSEPVNGLGLATPISLRLKSGTVLQEDTRIKIKASRGNNQSTDLVVRLTVQVRPNPAVVVQADPLILDHSTATKLTLTEFQPSATYTLYSRPLSLADYHTTNVNGDLNIANGEGGEIFVQSPARITNWDDPSGFVKLGDFVAASGPSPLIPLITDTLFIVRATKTDKDNGETLQLNQAVVVLVRPRSDPKMTTQDSLIAQGAAGTVQLSNTQRGVRYQLLKGGKTPVGAPGYHWEDRGVETMRIEVDFVVEQNEPQDAGGVLWLPTGALTKKTTFSVMATKVITGVPKPLDGTIAIDIKP